MAAQVSVPAPPAAPTMASRPPKVESPRGLLPLFEAFAAGKATRDEVIAAVKAAPDPKVAPTQLETDTALLDPSTRSAVYLAVMAGLIDDDFADELDAL